MSARLLRAALLLVVSALWLGSTIALQVHERLVQHIMCAEHGHTIELGYHHDTDHPADGQRRWRGAPQGDGHHHACEHEGVATPTVPFAAHLQTPLPPVLWPSTAPPTLRVAPRGPPLAYAPKTSPPAAPALGLA